eukprot:3396983-Ditylum_brightwellii.AAC.1
MEYIMVTGYGESLERNTTTDEMVVYGPVQDTTDALADWTLISSTNTKCYNKKAKGCKISDPSRCRIVLINANLFVDNVKLLHNNGNFHISAQELKHQVKQDYILWGRVLWLSGGLLEFNKRTYTIILWRFAPNWKTLVTPKENIGGGSLTINVNREGILLEYTDAADTLKMMGVHQAGNKQSNIEHTHL